MNPETKSMKTGTMFYKITMCNTRQIKLKSIFNRIINKTILNELNFVYLFHHYWLNSSIQYNNTTFFMLV